MFFIADFTVCTCYSVATLLGNMENPGIWEILKKPGKLGILNNFNMFSCKISIWHQKFI